MSIISLLIVLVVAGLVLYLIETYVPMSPPIKTVLRVVVVLVLCLLLLQAFGIWDEPGLNPAPPNASRVTRPPHPYGYLDALQAPEA